MQEGTSTVLGLRASIKLSVVFSLSARDLLDLKTMIKEVKEKDNTYLNAASLCLPKNGV